MNNSSWRMGDKEIDYIKRAVDSGLHGEWNRIFEEKFAEKIGVKYAIGVNSGTSALHCALYAAGVREDDEVIVPPLTFGAPAFATMFLGAVPVFADIDPLTFNIDPGDIENKITPKTRAIVPVSLYGLPADIDSIMAIAREHGLKVVEDDAECLLGKYGHNSIAGTLADLSIFSFQRSKHLTSETGGAVLTNSEELAVKARKFSILGYRTLQAKSGVSLVTMEQVQRPDFLRHEMVAPNYRLPELCAAMLTAQMDKMEMLVSRRREIAAVYDRAIDGCPWLVPQATPAGFINSYWTYAVRLGTGASGISWYEFRDRYIQNGGEPYYAAWVVNYLEPALAGRSFPGHDVEYRKGLCPVAERIQPQLMQLKTNFESLDYAGKQSEVLRKTIRQLSK